jgi:NAD(P)-dependent dehydrogenase (short-subunit alcohol dehydrogenase family)
MSLMTELRFDERVAVVTGAGRGIGRAHALLLAASGARVVVADHGVEIDGTGRSHGPADEVVEEITAAGGEACACYASVTQQDEAASIVQTALDRFGRLDIVINNAGIHDPGSFTELSADRFRAMFDVHFFGAVFVLQAAWPHFVEAGYGRVVNTVSEAMLGGIGGLTSYGAAKGAVLGLTRNLATEGGPLGIKANAIAPRAYTRMSASSSDKLAESLSMSKEDMAQVNASMPPDLCSPAAVYLAHESCAISGEVLQVGMGGVARLALVHTPGIVKAGLTPADVADNLDTILDVRDAHVTSSEMIGVS